MTGSTLHKKENPNARDRLLAYIARKGGDSVQAISGNLNRPNATTHGWPVRAGDGLGRLHDIGRPGLPRRMAGGQLAGLKISLRGRRPLALKPAWDRKCGGGYAPKRYGIGHVPRTMQEPMHEMNLRHAKPRSGHPKAASEKEKRRLKESRLATYSNGGCAILSGAAASHMLGWNTRR